MSITVLRVLVLGGLAGQINHLGVTSFPTGVNVLTARSYAFHCSVIVCDAMVPPSRNAESATTTEEIASTNDGVSNDEKDVGDEETSSKVHLARGDYRIIVSWMENEQNFAAVYGSKKTTVGGEPKMTKKQVFQVMADHLHKYSTTPKLPHLNSRNMEQRWKNHLAKFKKVLRMTHTQTGLGITIKNEQRRHYRRKAEEQMRVLRSAESIVWRAA
jgi:hypothetical protein